jgi:hypothetical protein
MSQEDVPEGVLAAQAKPSTPAKVEITESDPPKSVSNEPEKKDSVIEQSSV